MHQDIGEDEMEAEMGVVRYMFFLLLGCQTQSESRFHFVGFFVIFRVGKSLACHSPAKWWLCA